MNIDLLSHSVKKRFVKDYGLPIQLVQNPYFKYFIELYDPVYNSISKCDLLLSTINSLGGEKEFFETSDRIKNLIITKIKNLPEYEKLNSGDLEEFQVGGLIKKDDIFNQTNIDKTFISFDMKQANFQAMKFFDPNLVLGAKTYEDFMLLHTDLDYFIQSKYLRQVIFGNLNPKRQQKIQKYMIRKFIDDILINLELDVSCVKSQSSDELIIEAPGREEDILKLITPDWIRVDIFKLRSLGDKYYVKEFTDGKIEFKTIPGYLFAQLFKKWFNLPINQNDLSFFFEGQVAIFKDPI